MPSPISSISEIKLNIRKQLRKKRRNLSREKQNKASINLKKKLLTHPLFIRSKHIAFYLTNDGEIDPKPLLLAALKMGKHCYLPIIHPVKPGYLLFCRYANNDSLVKNKYGIWEPKLKHHRLRKPYALDLVLTPLVAFDEYGARMGMGGGYYDRTFSQINNKQTNKPLLVGLAHECQKVDQLKTDHWDIPMTGVFTDACFYG